MKRISIRKSFLLASLAGGIAVSASAQYVTVIEAGSGGLLQETNFSMNAQGPRGTGAGSTALGTSGVSHVWGVADPNAPLLMTFTFTPGVTPSNAGADWTTETQLGVDLNGNSVFASGLTSQAGQSGLYRVYFTSRGNFSDNIGAGLSTFTVSNDGEDLVAAVDLNHGTIENGQLGAYVTNQWLLLGTVELTAGNEYTFTQTAPQAFVGYRTHGVMFEPIPEPSTYAAIFGALALVGAAVYRRRLNAKS